MTHLPYPHRPDTVTHLLDGVWDAAFLGEVDPETLDPAGVSFTHRVSMPSALDTYPDWAGKRGVFALRTRYTHREDLTGILRLAGTGMWNRFYLSDDGGASYLHVGDVSLPYTPVQLPLPPATPGERELVVICDNRFNYQRTPLQSEYFDFYAYGGLFRSVTVQETGSWWLDRAQVRTESVEEGRVHVRILREGDLSEPASGHLILAGETVADIHFEAGAASVECPLTIPGLTPWSPERPALHLLEVNIEGQRLQERFGLRTVSVSGKEILLNGTPLLLKGFCRHEAHPQFGPSLPEAQLVHDLQLLRSMGCNFVRGSHYPQNQAFLDLCDEMGILVFEESLGWQQQDKDFESAAYRSACEKQTRLMVRTSINHPSIILWGYLNEGSSDSEASENLYPRLSAAIREEDSSRLVTYATHRPFNDRHLAQVDVISVNLYPGWYAPENLPSRPLDQIPLTLDKIRDAMKENPDANGKPMILSEIGAGAIYGWHDPHRAHWTEEYQADLLDVVLTEFLSRDEINGIAIWQFCDCRTYDNSYALRRPRAFNNKGVFDEYRRPKLAVETVTRHFKNA